MRTTINLGDESLDRAAELSGISDKAPLLREALNALIERQRRATFGKYCGKEARTGNGNF